MLFSYGDQDSLSTFIERRSTPEYIANVGEMFLLTLYGAVRSTSLDKLRYILFTRSDSRSSLSPGFKLESLPPTVPQLPSSIHTVHYLYLFIIVLHYYIPGGSLVYVEF